VIVVVIDARHPAVSFPRDAQSRPDSRAVPAGSGHEDDYDNDNDHDNEAEPTPAPH
jgi:hypothetical protein